MCDGGRGEAPRGVKKRGHCKTIAAAGKGRARVGRAVLVALALAGGGIAPLRAQELAATASQFLGALTYALTPRVVIDTGATAGLARGSPDWSAFAGVTVLF